jgi:hypothetical protein
MQNSDAHAKIVDALSDTHEERVIAILQELEDQVAKLLLSAPLSDGNLFDLGWALSARADIERIMRETFLTEIDLQIREYDKIIASLAEVLGGYTAFNGVPDDVINALKTVSFQGFREVASTFSNDLADELYRNALSGRPIDESIKNMRQKINGVYMASDEVEIERLVAKANAGDEDAIKKLHSVYAADKTGNNMRKYARQMVVDTVAQFDASINVAAGKESGVEKWLYYGDVIRDTRPFCQKHAGKELTEEYIRDYFANNDWAGKADGDPFIVRGGYNCRHHFMPVYEE